MKHIISFFARKPSEPVDGPGMSFVRLQVHEATLAGPIPIAIRYLAKSKLKIRKAKAKG
jgi:hypothetical protein